MSRKEDGVKKEEEKRRRKGRGGARGREGGTSLEL